MIENLKGIHETVNYKPNTNIRLYNNDENENYPAHWHTPIEIIMPTENDYHVEIGNHLIHLQLEDILFICPGVIHSLYAPNSGRRIIFQAETASLSAIHEIESFLGLIAPAIMIKEKDYPILHAKIKELLYSILDDYTKNQSMSESSIYAKVLQLLVLLGRNQIKSFENVEASYLKQKEYSEKFIFICHYIHLHCTQNLTLDEISNLAGFSKYHFSRLFKQFTNVTFYKYLNMRRIAQAEKLLIDPTLSITEVSILCGYSSLSAFIRMFKIIKDCTPTEFKQMYISSGN